MGTGRRASWVIVACGLGLLVGAFLLANGPGPLRHPPGSPLGDPVWTDDADLRLSLALSLILLGTAAWHVRRFALGKLVVIGLLAAGALLTSVFDAGSGPPVWDRDGYYEGDELVGIVMFIASAVAVLIGVAWSSFSEAPAGSKSLWAYLFGAGPGGTYSTSSPQGLVVDEGQPAPEGWWLAADGKWYPPEIRAGYVPPPPGPDEPQGDEAHRDEPQVDGPRSPWWRQPWVVLAGGLAVLWIGLMAVFAAGGDFPGSDEPAVEDDDRGPVQDEQWRIDLGDEDAGIHTIHLIKTFRPLDEGDVDEMGGRLVWPETEIALCAVGIRAVGDGFLQIGDIFRTSEGCDGDSRMQEVFADFGLPETACVFVRANDIEHEHCAPLDIG